ncbi:MAG: rhamnulose-1-phosphate aldolase [Lachnospiraceae bacterium]|nr:rhamnulose-1-phosphate aldolase [Lachnospiraceae bacterium]
MKNIKEAPFLQEITRLTSNMYRLGWDERNGGNVSYLVSEEELKDYIDFSVIRTLPLNFHAPELAGKIYLVTGTGCYFKNMELFPETNLGLIRITEDGDNAELLWGYEDGGKPTSELPSHLMGHIERLKIDPEQRIVIHCHPTNTIAMTLTEDLDEKEFSKKLWRANTECIVVFPEGVGVLPWQLCGTIQIGIDTSKKMKDYRTVIWANHGIFGTGKTVDEAFGLIETVEKTAQVFMIARPNGILNTITDAQLKELTDAFGVTDQVKEGWLG